MSVFGIGSMYGSTEEKLPDFIQLNHAFVGYQQDEAKFIHGLLRSMKIGDIVFVKSFSGPNGLYLKAVGVVTSLEIFRDLRLGYGIPVKWFWVHNDKEPVLKLGKLADKGDNMRGGTLYEEFGPEVITAVLDKLYNRNK